MKRIFASIIILLFCASNVFAATGWVKTKPALTDNPGTAPTTIGENNAALDLMLSKYRQGCKITYLTAATLTVESGGVMVSNSDGSTRLMVANTSNTSVSWSDIDTGSEAGSTTYYVYAIASGTTATTFTVKISTNSSAPSGVTYYQRLGSFYNDGSSNITNIINDDLSETGKVYDSGWFAVSASSSYAKTHSLGTTKASITLLFSNNSDGSGVCATTRPPATASDSSMYVSALSATSITIDTATKIWTTEGTYYSSGYARVLMLALE